MLGASNAFASDGFDNNYIDADANQMYINLNGNNRCINYGPGLMSGGGFFINVPNGSTYNAGTTSIFTLNEIRSTTRSAYWDRVLATTLYYRVYLTAASPPAWNSVDLNPLSTLPAGTCYTLSQGQQWSSYNTINILQGLGGGNYVFEFYVQSTLYDVGIEAGNPCSINALLQCNSSEEHNGRFLTSRLSVTDPTACNWSNLQANLANPSKVFFSISGPLPLTWDFFKGEKTDEGVALHWGTLQEVDMDHFDVERSGDGLRWSVLDHLGARGQAGRYDWIDRRPLSGRNYYRLRAVEVTGAEMLSGLLTVANGADSAPLLPYPNPAGVQLNCLLPEGEDVNVRMYDLYGRLLREVYAQGNTLLELSLEGMAPGPYFLECVDGQGQLMARGRFIKG